jgi:ATPases with chaperone activity, ATP-binding subunit
MEIKFSTDLQTILCYARDEAMRTGSYGVGADHLVLGLLRHRDNEACRILTVCGIDLDALKEAVDARVMDERPVPWQDQALIRPTRGAAALVGGAAYEALKQGGHEIFPAHLLLALVRHEKSIAAELLRSRQLDYDRVFALMRERQVIPEPTGMALPRVEELLGPLGEQLTRLYAEARSETTFFS